LRECEAEELWRTLKHELAHLVAYERCGRRQHRSARAGVAAACSELGIPNEKPYHNAAVQAPEHEAQPLLHLPQLFLTIHRVKPIQRTVACYDCCRKFNQGAYHDRFRLIKQKSN
jgi:SprT protein